MKLIKTAILLVALPYLVNGSNSSRVFGNVNVGLGPIGAGLTIDLG